MRPWMALLLVSVWLGGCQQVPPPAPELPVKDSQVADQGLTYIEGGWSLGDALVFYEAHYRQGQLWRIAERIEQGSQGVQRTDYYYRENHLEQVISEGAELDVEAWQVQRRRFWMRFRGDHFFEGEQFLNGQEQRLSSDVIARIQSEARQVLEHLEQLLDNGERLWRGFWDGERFTPCHEENSNYALLADMGDWDWLSSFTERLRNQGERRPVLIFIGLQQPQDGMIEMTQLMSMQPANADACTLLEPLAWDSRSAMDTK